LDRRTQAARGWEQPNPTPCATGVAAARTLLLLLLLSRATQATSQWCWCRRCCRCHRRCCPAQHAAQEPHGGAHSRAAAAQVYNSSYLGPVYRSFDERWDAMVIAKRNVYYVNRHSAPLLLEDCTLDSNAFLWGAIVTPGCTNRVSTSLMLTRRVDCRLVGLLSAVDGPMCRWLDVPALAAACTAGQLSLAACGGMVYRRRGSSRVAAPVGLPWQLRRPSQLVTGSVVRW
jgi:hypothetical protein